MAKLDRYQGSCDGRGHKPPPFSLSWGGEDDKSAGFLKSAEAPDSEELRSARAKINGYALYIAT